jgi:hypothetical protein
VLSAAACTRRGPGWRKSAPGLLFLHDERRGTGQIKAARAAARFLVLAGLVSDSCSACRNCHHITSVLSHDAAAMSHIVPTAVRVAIAPAMAPATVSAELIRHTATTSQRPYGRFSQ